MTYCQIYVGDIDKIIQMKVLAWQILCRAVQRETGI